MQIIDVYDGGSNYEIAATKLKDALAQYGSAYFDSYDTDFTAENGVKIVQCKIGQTVAVEIAYKGDTGYLRLCAGGKAISPHATSNYRFSNLYVFENAILLVYKYATNYGPEYAVPILLCKKKNGDTALVFFADGNLTKFTSAGNGSSFSCVLSVSRSTGATDFSVLPTCILSNNAGSVSGYSLFSFNDGNLLKDVFLVIDSDFRSHAEPFAYTLNNVTYTGFAGNYLAVKGT